MIIKPINNFFNFSGKSDLLAIIKSDQTFTYENLFERAAQLSFSFLDKGINKGDYVPMFFENSLSFIQTTIALWYLGAVPVPLNTKILNEEIYTIIDDYDFKFLITDKELSLNITTEELKIICFDKLLDHSYKTNAIEFPALNDEAVVIFTSGSTARPKGVMHTFTSLINNIENGNQILNHNVNDRWLASLPFYHIGGFQIICRSLFYGCSIIIPKSLQTIHLADAILNHNPTHISLVSTQLERLMNQDVTPNELLKVSLIGGGFINDDLIFESDKLGWKPFRVYGSSETASMVTAISPDEIKNKPQSAGKTFNNVEIKISSESEILIKSNSLFSKYLNDEKETSEKIKNGFYHSGDLGFVDDDGYLFIEARINDLIVTGGENVNPIEVEKTLLEFPFIKEACVFSKPDKTWGQIVVAAIVVNNSSFIETSIKEMLKQKLAGYKIPKKFFFVDKLPRTSLGKLEREKIRKKF